MFSFCDLRVLARKLASPFGHPTLTLYASSTCVHLWLLAGPFDQGLMRRTMTVHVVIILGTFLCRPLQNNNVKWSKFCVVWRTWTTKANFLNFFFILSLCSRLGFVIVLTVINSVKFPLCPFGHPTQVSMQVQLASTCDYLAVRLARA